MQINRIIVVPRRDEKRGTFVETLGCRAPAKGMKMMALPPWRMHDPLTVQWTPAAGFLRHCPTLHFPSQDEFVALDRTRGSWISLRFRHRKRIEQVQAKRNRAARWCWLGFRSGVGVGLKLRSTGKHGEREREDCVRWLWQPWLLLLCVLRAQQQR